MEREPLIIYGAGAFGREVMYAVIDNQAHGVGPDLKPAGFIDMQAERVGQTHEGLPVFSAAQVAADPHLCKASFICGIGSPDERVRAIGDLLAAIPEARLATVVHRSAVIMPGVILGKGVYVGCNSTVGIASTLADHAVVNFNCSIGHDCTIGPYVVISPGCVLSGGSSVGEGSFLGSGAVTYPGIKIGVWCMVGAQGTVARPLKDRFKLIPKPNEMLLPPEMT